MGNEREASLVRHNPKSEGCSFWVLDCDTIVLFWARHGNYVGGGTESLHTKKAKKEKKRKTEKTMFNKSKA